MATKKAVDTSTLSKRAAAVGADAVAASKQLSQYFELTEKKLAGHGLTFATSVDLGIPADRGEGAFTWALSYERGRNGWQLMARVSDPTGDLIERDAQPIGNAPRHIRIAAANALPELIDVIVTSLDEQNARMRAALKVVESVIDVNSPAPTPEDDGGDS
jgi:hypothetical protein